MISKLTFFPKKKKSKKIELKNIVSEIKKENWKTSESTIKKLKQYRNDPEKILERFRKVHRKKYDYSKVEYINSKTKLIIICQKHGEFQIDFHRHLKLGCTKCHNDKMALIYKKTNENFIKEFRKVHGNKYNYSKVNYINCNTKNI